MANPYTLDFNPLASAITDNQQMDLARNRLAMDQKRLGFEAERLGFERDQHPLRLENLRLGNVSAQQGVERERQTLPLDIKYKNATIAGQGLQNQSTAQSIEAKKRELQKELYGRAAVIGQMVESEPDPEKQKAKLLYWYDKDPVMKAEIGKALPKELMDDPVAVTRYLARINEGVIKDEVTKLGPGDALIGRRRDPNNPTAQPSVAVIARNPKANEPPTGYELDPTKPGTGALRPIAGGPADKITGEQAARTALILGGIQDMDKIRKIFLGTPAKGSEDAKPAALGGNMNPFSYAQHYTGVGDVGEGHRLMASGMEGVLRALTGAAATKEEVAREVQKYLPLPSDRTATREQKLNLFERNLNLIANLSAHGMSGSDILKAMQTGTLDAMKTQGRVSQQGDASAAPKVGEVRKGHVFIGGDPAQPASWAKVQQ
jgi:hypothetical protein